MKNTQISKETAELAKKLELKEIISQEVLQKYFLEQKFIIVSVGKLTPGKFISKSISFNKEIGYFILTTEKTYTTKTEALEEGLQLTLKKLIGYGI